MRDSTNTNFQNFNPLDKMIIHQEQTLIKKFVIKDKQDRYLTFLAKEKTRKKFTDELHFFKNLDWKMFREIPGSENEYDAIISKVKRKKNILTCHVISENSNFDGQTISADEAIKNIVGVEGTILIFGDAEVVYYVAEPPSGRYISI